uniref:Uncharacterized protein n=1 Tax=Cucumis melo TaxID=3656 RepID=A0A9I9EB48_CUCME
MDKMIGLSKESVQFVKVETDGNKLVVVFALCLEILVSLKLHFKNGFMHYMVLQEFIGAVKPYLLQFIDIALQKSKVCLCRNIRRIFLLCCEEGVASVELWQSRSNNVDRGRGFHDTERGDVAKMHTFPRHICDRDMIMGCRPYERL